MPGAPPAPTSRGGSLLPAVFPRGYVRNSAAISRKARYLRAVGSGTGSGAAFFFSTSLPAGRWTDRSDDQGDPRRLTDNRLGKCAAGFPKLVAEYAKQTIPVSLVDRGAE